MFIFVNNKIVFFVGTLKMFFVALRETNLNYNYLELHLYKPFNFLGVMILYYQITQISRQNRHNHFRFALQYSNQISVNRNRHLTERLKLNMKCLCNFFARLNPMKKCGRKL